MKDPAFLFYSSDFLSGTMLMTNEDVGKYIRLLCLQHQKGHLKEKDLLSICKEHNEEIFSKFKQDEEGNYYNERLEYEANKRKSYSESRRNNRKKKTYEKDMKNICNSYEEHMENENININNKEYILNYINNNKLDNIINLLLEYFNYRKSIKIPNNQNIIDELILFLKPYNRKEQEQIIKTSLKNGYREFYPPKKEKGEENGTEYRRI